MDLDGSLHVSFDSLQSCPSSSLMCESEGCMFNDDLFGIIFSSGVRNRIPL